jgi:hypothetical protein
MCRVSVTHACSGSSVRFRGLTFPLRHMLDVPYKYCRLTVFIQHQHKHTRFENRLSVAPVDFNLNTPISIEESGSNGQDRYKLTYGRPVLVYKAYHNY